MDGRFALIFFKSPIILGLYLMALLLVLFVCELPQIENKKQNIYKIQINK